MQVTVCMPLFGNAGHELEEGTPVQGKQLRAVADELRDRLHKAADTLDRLQAAGWSATVTMYDAILTHEGAGTREEVERQLQALGIDPAEMMILEEVEEEDE